jgi:GNAT superfamily N-acetyltransferase
MPTVIPLRSRPELSSFFVKLFEAEWPDWYGPGHPADAASDLREYANAAGALPVRVIALDDAGDPVGIAALKATSISTHPHLSPWAAAGYVIPSLRRNGTGRVLLSALLAEAKRLGFQKIYCATATSASLLVREGWSQIDSVNYDGTVHVIFERLVEDAA